MRFLNLAILAMLVGCSAVIYAQDEKPQDERPTRQEEPKPEPKRDDVKPQDEAKPHPDEAKPPKQEKREQNGHPEQQARNGRPAGKGGHIPDDKFRAHFGRNHAFTAKAIIVQGRPQFQYGGYSFELVDVWPEGWAYTDECYIDYIDGEYFLFDLLHPGVRVAVFVVM